MTQFYSKKKIKLQNQEEYSDDIVYDTIDILEELKNFVSHAYDLEGMLKVSMIQGELSCYLKFYKDAIIYLKKARDVATELDDNQSKMKAYNLMAFTYKKFKQYDNAIKCYKKLMQYAYLTND